VDFRVPEESKIEKYRDDSRFDYGEKESKIADFSFIDRIWYWIYDNLGHLSPENFVWNKYIGIIMIVVLVLLIVLVIIKLSGVKLRALIGKKKLDTPEIEIYAENVHEMNFEQLIAQAVSNKDYRLATRFMYLRNLKSLTDKKIINWNPNKTNYSYQYEISDNDLRQQFVNTTFIFDYVWYGEFALDDPMFAVVSEQLNNLSKTVAK